MSSRRGRRGTKQRQWRSKSPQAAAPHPSVAAVEASHLHHKMRVEDWCQIVRDERIQWYPVSDEEKQECSAFNMWNPFKSQILNHQRRHIQTSSHLSKLVQSSCSSIFPLWLWWLHHWLPMGPQVMMLIEEEVLPLKPWSQVSSHWLPPWNSTVIPLCSLLHPKKNPLGFTR